jgi:hypothetical protein
MTIRIFLPDKQYFFWKVFFNSLFFKSDNIKYVPPENSENIRFPGLKEMKFFGESRHCLKISEAAKAAGIRFELDE